MTDIKRQRRFLKFMKVARLMAALLWALLFVAAFLGCAFLTPLVRCQAGPALGSLGLGAVLALALIAVLTLIFGRFYCGLVCPMGILQEVLGFGAKLGPRRTHAVWRAFLAGALLGGVFIGSSLVLQLFDPYASFGRIVTLGGCGALLAFLAFLVLARFGRLFCDVVCPVGALLGLIARHSLYRLQISMACRHCGLCQKSCPAGCLDSKAGTLDDSRCLRCLRCLEACREGAIALLPAGRAQEGQPDFSRRQFLTREAPALLAGLALGAASPLALRPLLRDRLGPLGVLPPGAGDYGRFIFKCTNCRLCAANCPAKVIKSPKCGFGPVTLDFSKGGCLEGCVKCSNLCPTGALLPVSPSGKGRLVIGKVVFDASLCQVFQEGRECGLCQKKCPYGAVELFQSGAPKFKKDLCLGCGNCVAVCPKKAISVEGVKIQHPLSDD